MRFFAALALLLLIAGCASPANAPVEVYFCRVDDCASALGNVLSGAKHSICFMTYEFTDRELADILIERSAVIDVRGVIERQRLSQQYNKFDYLRRNGVDVIPDKNNATMHHKVFLIDQSVVVTGSFNPTKSANERNDENMLVIHDRAIAEKYLAEFWRVYG